MGTKNESPRHIELKSFREICDNHQHASGHCPSTNRTDRATDRSDSLTPTSFFIPSFQRGYRWSALQVEQLVKDLVAFYDNPSRKPNDWYCLQPLVVVPLDENSKGHWCVLDGQQRLTTLYLLGKRLGLQELPYTTQHETRKIAGPENAGVGEHLYTIQYETRKGSSSFLANLGKNEENDEKNSRNDPDYYFMRQAWKTIQGIHIPDGLKDTLLDHTKFIWFETQGNPYEEFTRLNTGKISLCNAELMKALLLKDSMEGECDGHMFTRLEIAKEWDMMEQFLRNDDFWCFINPDSKHERFDAMRLDFLFEILLRLELSKYREDKKDSLKYLQQFAEKLAQSGKENQMEDMDVVKEWENNHYFIFYIFQEFCEAKNGDAGAHEIWRDMQRVFRHMQSWFDDTGLFHRIGYLTNRKSYSPEIKFSNLCRWLKYADEVTKSDFRSQLDIEIRESLVNDETAERKALQSKLENLQYGISNDQLNDVLLLFNIVLVMRQKQEQGRYPFRNHRKAYWTLEHIHAQNERRLNSDDLKTLAKYLGIASDGGMEDSLIASINDRFKSNPDVFGTLQIVDEEGNKAWHFKDGTDIHGLENLALLGHRANATFNDSLFHEKQSILALWEKGEREEGELNRLVDNGFDKVEFVPMASRMVFFRHFSTKPRFPFVWTENDAEEYFNAIVSSIAAEFGFQKEATKIAGKNDGGTR